MTYTQVSYPMKLVEMPPLLVHTDKHTFISTKNKGQKYKKNVWEKYIEKLEWCDTNTSTGLFVN